MHACESTSLRSFSRYNYNYTTFYTEGEMIDSQELEFIAKMLKNSAIDFGNYVHLINNKSDVTYEEMEFIMKLNPKTQLLSINLKQEITSSKH